MNKYIFYIILISNFSFSQERRITRQANSYIIENQDSISMDKAINKYNNAIKLNYSSKKWNNEELETSLNQGIKKLKIFSTGLPSIKPSLLVI